MAKPINRRNSSAVNAPAPERMRAFALDLFDRKDGTGADWQGMADVLFRLAFQTLDKLPEDARQRMAVRVHAGAYERVLATDAASGDGGFPGLKEHGKIRPGADAPAIRPELAP